MANEIHIGQEDHLPAGALVEVRNKYDDEFCSGFEITQTTDSGYVIRRRSDGAELPVVFPAVDVKVVPGRR